MTYINTEPATIERAKELLSTAPATIYVRWYRSYDGGNTGTPWGRVKQYTTCQLIGVTAKRLKLKELYGGAESTVDPKFCFFAAPKTV